MSPVERALALGWSRDPDRWWVTPYSDDRTYPAGCWSVSNCTPWATGWRGEWVWYHQTEDAALEHALLLRDVWLS